jgi:thioredoxin
MEITSIELQEKINNGEKVIVDFWASFCGPCRMLKPIFEKVSSENTTEVQMYTLNVEENRELASKVGIRAIPTIKSFNNGNVVDTKVGILQESQIKELVKNLLNG